MKRWLVNAAIDAASWTLGKVADVLLGKVDGEPYVSTTTIEQSRLETMSLEALQEELNEIRSRRRQVMLYVSCPNCGPVCICRGGFRL